MTTVIQIVVGLMGVLSLLSLIQTGLLYNISLNLGKMKARINDLERRVKNVENK